MARFLLNLTGVLVILAAAAVPAWVGYRSTVATRNLRVVREGVLYRSGQMTISGLKRTSHDFGIKTVISLRDAHRPGDVAPDAREEEFCNKQEIAFHRIVLGRWYAEDGSTPAEEGVRLFRDIMADPANYPVLVHCLAGIHRTGAACAIYRMEQEHWSNERAMREMKESGYDTLDDEWDILGYLEIYQPTWKEPMEPTPVRRRPPGKPGVKQTRHSSRAER
jgi:tyrosine-protein phosphatase SIW14